MRASGLSAIVGSILVTGVLAVPGCGGDSESKNEEKQPSGTVDCGPLRCDQVILPAGYDPIPACCADGNVCGLDGSRFQEFGANFEDPCQARDQPGNPDPDCPSSTPIPTELGPELVFPGCCKPDGQCGYLADTALNLVTLGLGCVEAAPFLDGGVPTTCTPQ
jgi:hypothetical protein